MKQILKRIKLCVLAAFTLTAFLFISCATISEWAQTEKVNASASAVKPQIVALHYEFKIVPTISTPVDFILVLPKNYPEHQKVVKETFSIEPSKIFVDGGNRYATFHMDSVKETQILAVDFEVAIWRYDWSTANKQRQSVQPLDMESFNTYTSEEKFLETSNPALIQKAKELVGEDDKATVTNIHRFVTRHMKYQYQNDELGAYLAYKEKIGDCNDFTDLFVTLCRINKIPARTIDGYTALGNGREVGHSWAEVYFNDIGWVPFDPTWAATDYDSSLKKLRNVYVYMSTKRNDKNLLNRHFCVWQWYNRFPLYVYTTRKIFYKN